MFRRVREGRHSRKNASVQSHWARKPKTRSESAAQALVGQSHASRERDQLFAVMRSQTQLLKSALQLQRLATERGKPDPQRERGYQPAELRDVSEVHQLGGRVRVT